MLGYWTELIKIVERSRDAPVMLLHLVRSSTHRVSPSRFLEIPGIALSNMKRLLIRIKRHIKTSKNPKSPIQASSDLVPDWDRPRETSRPKIEISSSDGPKDVQNQHNPLDSLPAEIRRHLLFILDLAQLKTLVFASPTFHEQYLLDRQSILCRSLETTLPSTVVDAKAVYEFSLVSTLKKDIPAFLLSYAENVKQRYSSPANRLILDEAIGMASFYFRSVKPIVEYYARWALDNLSRSLGQICHSHDVEVALTTMETVRLARAVYRFELLCQLVNPVDRPFNIPRERFIRSLFDIIEPWEVEELVSFYQFAQSIYDGAFRDVRWDLHMNNPKFDGQGRPPTPEGAFDLDNSCKLSISFDTSRDSQMLLNLINGS